MPETMCYHDIIEPDSEDPRMWDRVIDEGA